jgi:hypothetical protein
MIAARTGEYTGAPGTIRLASEDNGRKVNRSCRLDSASAQHIQQLSVKVGKLALGQTDL